MEKIMKEWDKMNAIFERYMYDFLLKKIQIIKQRMLTYQLNFTENFQQLE
jgi:hypothetical protein